MFRLRSSTYFLRGHNMLCLPKPLTTSYGINSFSYLAATSWNSLSDHYRTISDFTSFRRLISTENNNLLKREGTVNLSTSSIRVICKLVVQVVIYLICYIELTFYYNLFRGMPVALHGENPVRLYPKLQSQPIGLRKICIDYLIF